MSVDFWDYTDDESGRFNETGELEIGLRIRTDNTADSLSTLRRDLPQFQRWQPHATEPGFFVQEFSAEKAPYSDPPWWDAKVRYSNQLRNSPLDERVKITVRTETIAGATIFDKDGQVILNAAGEVVAPFDRPRRVRVFTFTKNLAAPQDWLFELEDAVNASSVRIYSKNCPPRTLLLQSVNIGDRQSTNDIDFYVHTIELRYLRDGWDIIWPQRGWTELVEETDQEPGSPTFGQSVKRRRKIYLPGGAEPTQPVFLDAQGRAMHRPEPDQILTTTSKLLEEADLNRLPLR